MYTNPMDFDKVVAWAVRAYSTSDRFPGRGAFFGGAYKTRNPKLHQVFSGPPGVIRVDDLKC